MAIIKKSDMKTMNMEDLEKKLGELRMEYSKERGVTSVGGSSKSPGRIREMRRTIAKLILKKHMAKIAKNKSDAKNVNKKGVDRDK